MGISENGQAMKLLNLICWITEHLKMHRRICLKNEMFFK